MDVTLARTFLEIASSGSFLRASERLHVTQTAVSARVKTLETQLGRQLFVRNRSGAVLTPAGEQFVRHATTLIQVWERARQQVSVPPGRRAMLAIGCEASLWDPLLLEWLRHMRRAAPDLALRTEVSGPSDLLGQVANGMLEIAVLYAPQHRPGIRVDLLFEEKLVFVTSARDGRVPKADQYVNVDWGPEFAAQHCMAYPELATAGVSTNLGPLGLGHLLSVGGAGYFRRTVVRKYLESGQLYGVKGAPEFAYPAYAVHLASADAELLAPALEGLREVTRGAAATGARGRRGKGAAR